MYFAFVPCAENVCVWDGLKVIETGDKPVAYKFRPIDRTKTARKRLR